MKLSFWIRYATLQTYWFSFKPFRKGYRYLFRPTLYGTKVIVLNGDRILLVRPNYAHRLWTLPGGIQDRGETPEACAIREVKEEAGPALNSVQFLRDYETMRDGCRNIVRTFVAHTDAEELQADGIEIREAQWFPLNALPRDRNPRVDETLRHAAH